MNASKGALVAAAASLFLTGAAHAPAANAAEHAEKTKCEGVNSCKGHSACKTATSSCKGQNACKGKGFLMLTPEECEEAKAEMAKDDMDEGDQG